MNLLEHMKFKMLMRNQIKMECSKTKNQSKFPNHFFQTGKNKSSLFKSKVIVQKNEINYVMLEKHKNYLIEEYFELSFTIRLLEEINHYSIEYAKQRNGHLFTLVIINSVILLLSVYHKEHQEARYWEL